MGNVDVDGLARVSEQIPPGAILVNKESPVNTADRPSGPDLALPDEGTSLSWQCVLERHDACLCGVYWKTTHRGRSAWLGDRINSPCC